MSTTTISQISQKHKKEKAKERTSSQPQPNERLKTVVRRLPPNLPEEIFWQSVQPWVTEETAVWKVFYPGKLRKKLNKENVPSRAYIAFKNEEQLALFSRGYDGHVFRDKTGVESQAVVEFAPYPKVPSEKRKPDTRNATIEKDEDYISFLESLKASENAEPVSLESLIASSQPPPPPKTTPLLEALKAEKSANKDKESILRNHAHYTQISSRKDDKKKTVPNSLPSKPSEAPFADSTSGGGKKGPKKGPSTQTNPPPVSGSKGAGSGAAPKNAAANQPPVNQPTKPAKAPRPPRPPQAKATTNDAAARVNPPTPTLITAPSDGSAAATPAVPAPRRTRPVIGLASRQFEAALSGVSGLAGAASERKRREREKEKEEQAVTPASGAPSGPASSFARIDAPETEETPPSPKKERSRRGGRGRGGAPADGSQVKVLNILQRPEVPPPVVVQKDASGPINGSANGAAAAPNPVPNQPAIPNTSGNAPRGGSRRGRGRGRGGGVPAAAPRGG